MRLRFGAALAGWGDCLTEALSPQLSGPSWNSHTIGVVLGTGRSLLNLQAILIRTPLKSGQVLAD